jgi:hypothetical protein
MHARTTSADPRLNFDQLQLALAMSGVSVWRMDIETQRVHANDEGFRMLGLTPRPDGWDSEDLLQAVHPDDRQSIVDAAHQARVENRPVEMMARFRHADGRWHHVLTRRTPIRNQAGDLVSFLGMAIDVTERVATEQHLSNANQRIALIARTSGIGTWEWDLPDGESRWDEQMFLLRGLPPGPKAPSIEEMTQLLHPDDRDHVSQQILRAAAGSGPTQYEFRVMLADGRTRWLASRSVPLFDAQGHLVRRLGVNWDITAGREAEAQRQAKALAERESQAKSELLARMSHELRTPLNAILGFTELLIANGSALDTGARLVRLEHIQSAGRHLLALINDVLELARPGADAAEVHPLGSVPLDTMFAETLPLVEGAAAGRDITLRYSPSVPPDLAAQADPLWLKQVLLNLLTNAVKYNRQGGWVDLSARAVSAGRLCITVRDGGQGMTAEALERAFEPFQRAADRQPGVPGVGIGLAVVKTLMERMGGEVSARSTAGAGSEFELWLAQPGAEAVVDVSEALDTEPGALAALSAAEASSDAPANAPVLLYIEDHPVNVMIVQELAERWPGLDFHSAPDGASGLRMATELAPSMILLDMQLPDLHGLEVMDRLRADPRTSTIPCIALSANAMPEDISHALERGFTDYWTKPLDFSVFNRAMQQLFQATAG